MALSDVFRRLANRVKQYTYARMLSGYTPIFSQFGTDIYASDVVQNCVDVIASEISKLQPRHIRTDANGMQTVPRSDLNRLFKFSPNELMTTKEFLEKIVWLLYLKYNVFIYPVFTESVDASGNVTRTYTAMYPLNPTQVDFLQDETGRLYVKLFFSNGDNFTVPYSDIIHLRKKYSVNEIMGGGLNGLPDNAPLLKVLQINDTVLQGLEKGIKTSLSVRGILKVNTMLEDEAQRKERERFEKLMQSGESAILPVDIKGDFTPITIDPKLIDSETLAFLQNKVLHWFGVPLPILTGDYNDDQYQAFYEKTLEPIVISLGQAFSRTLFTQRELDVGNEIVFYHRDMMYLSTRTKLDLIKIAGEQGLLTDDQKLALLGFPPLADGTGSRRTMSLNYIDVTLANQYQLLKSTGKTKAVDESE